jgi:hypothetical protein
MRYSTLVYSAFLTVFVSLATGSAIAQKAEEPVQKDSIPFIEIKPVEDIVVEYLANSDRERGGDSAASYVMGRVTDFGGRSVRGAEVTLFSLDSDEMKRVTTNAFGYYRFPNLGEGESYLIGIAHRRYIFVMGSVSFTVEGTPVQIDFQAEEMR